MLVHLVPDTTALPAPPNAEGFVHLCWGPQVASVLERHFAGQAAVALVLDLKALSPDLLREEDSYGHGAFPHYYGVIPLECILRRHAVALVDGAMWVDGVLSDWGAR